MILSLMTCGSAWPRCCRRSPSKGTGTQAGFGCLTVLHWRALCTCCARVGLVGRPCRRGGLLGHDRLAPAAGLDRSRCLAPAARGTPYRTTQDRPARDGRLRDRRLPCQGLQRGDDVGPSPVDRARPGSKHHLIVDRLGTPLAVSVTGGNRHDVTQLIPLLDAIPQIRGLRGRRFHGSGSVVLVARLIARSQPHRVGMGSRQAQSCQSRRGRARPAPASVAGSSAFNTSPTLSTAS